MYLSINQCEILDGICNRFEVALRSYVANTLLVKSKLDKKKIREYLSDIANSYSSVNSCMPIVTMKYTEKAKFLNSLNIYEMLNNSLQSHIKKDVIDGDVIAVGQLVDLILLFYNPNFISLANYYDNHEQFLELITFYHATRNKLAHPASAKILKKESIKLTDFIVQSFTNIDDDYFWYSSKNEINVKVIEITNSLNANINIKHNLDTIPKKHNQLLLRDSEIEKLISLFFGESKFGKSSDSVELHGYGGVGKTALSLELCYEILRREINNKGIGYNFILCLTAKVEELTYIATTGRIILKETKPTFQSCIDILNHLKVILELDVSTTEDQLFELLFSKKIKGLILLDNLETIEDSEKKEIKKLIKRSPPGVQFLLTSRNYEGIASDDIEVKGFSDIETGKSFINEYCLLNNFNNDFEDKKIKTFIKYSYGNTLIMVIYLLRIYDGLTTLDNVIDELQVYQNKEIDIIADFMYKKTFESTIKEIEKEGYNIDVKKILRILLLYKEGIDFTSLWELLGCTDARQLEYILSRLVTKFIIVKNGGYYELHEFAEKFVILKLLPDQIELKKLDSTINDYKLKIKESLKSLYEDKANYSKLEPILDDWKAVTEAETIAIAQAYSEYEKVKLKLERSRNNKDRIKSVLLETKAEFKKIEARSYHHILNFKKEEFYLPFYMQMGLVIQN